VHQKNKNKNKKPISFSEKLFSIKHKTGLLYQYWLDKKGTFWWQLDFEGFWANNWYISNDHKDQRHVVFFCSQQMSQMILASLSL